MIDAPVDVAWLVIFITLGVIVGALWSVGLQGLAIAVAYVNLLTALHRIERRLP